jgi:DNA-binding beta-propeller fold protein YncE
MQEEERKEEKMKARSLILILILVLAGGFVTGAPAASASRKPLVHKSASPLETWLLPDELARLPSSTGEQIEGACGLAVSPDGTLYVSDYYHRDIHSFTLAGTYSSTLALPGGDPFMEINKLNAVCGLAADATGDLYANEFHQGVVRLLPSEESIDPGRATGVAVDEDGNLYVDDRTYVAVYNAPVKAGEKPAEEIGLNSLGEAFGVAVDSKAGRVYVADASDETVKGFDLAASLTAPPVVTIAGPPGKASFNSLFNSTVAVDSSPTEGQGHVLVVDNLEPLHARPQAAVYEFDASGSFLAKLASRAVDTSENEIVGGLHGPIFGEPSGIAVDPKSGDVFVTTGNSEKANVFVYGPYEGEAPALTEGGEPPAPGGGGFVARSSTGDIATSGSGDGPPAAASVVAQQRGVRVKFDGKLTPHALPRHGTAPVGIVVDATIGTAGGEDPPQLQRITIAINRNGHFASQGLPVCGLDQIQPSTTKGALEACGASLVGEGYFSANVKLPQQSPFPSEGKVLAFNGLINGHPAILAHIYGTQPAPTSTVLSFLLKSGHGAYGTVLEASLPQATGSWGYVTGLRMSLRRRFSYRGRARSYLSAGCPAPAGFPSAAFPLARTSFVFAGDLTLASVLNRTCRAKG